jgi:hypothetical protein
MTGLIVIILSVFVLISLIIVKAPLMYWYYRLRKEMWHHWFIWKIERKLAKTSIEKEKLLLK